MTAKPKRQTKTKSRRAPSRAAASRRKVSRSAKSVTSGAKVRKFEGASRGRRTGGWFTSSASANTENAPALVTLRNRSRDLVRNNSYAKRAVQGIANNVIGTGIVAQIKPKLQSKKNALSTPVQELMAVWRDWADTTDCDFDGLHTLYGIQRLAMRTIAESGEVLILQKRRKVKKGEIPIQLQVLEPDFIDTLKTERTTDGGKIIQGIEFDKDGRRVAYWLFPEHPGEVNAATSNSAMSVRHDADSICHLFEVLRPGQVRGIPFGTTVIIKLKDFDEFEDAQLTRQKVSACFTAFIEDMELPAEIKEIEDSVQAGDKLQPGAIEILPNGKRITFPNPPQVTGYKEFSDVSLHGVASGFGAPYELVTGDYSQVNFSSAKMGWSEFQRNIDDWQWNLVIPRFCQIVWKWFQTAAIVAGYTVASTCYATWTTPRRTMIDPTREIPATVEAIRAGLMTLSEAIRENGYDPDEHFAELAADAKRIDELGLILDSDARKTMKAGTVQTIVADDSTAKEKSKGG